jgi:hypothetical protein
MIQPTTGNPEKTMLEENTFIYQPGLPGAEK